MLTANGSPLGDVPVTTESLSIVAADRQAQEDSLRVNFASSDTVFAIAAGYEHDFSRESNGAMELTFQARSYDAPATVQIGMDCDPDRPCSASLPVELGTEWLSDVRISADLNAAADCGDPSTD